MDVAKQLEPLLLDIHELTPDPANARVHPERNMAAIKASISKFGIDQPLVAQKHDGKLIVRKGNGRLAAALALGYTKVPVVVIEEGDTEAVARAIADNRSAELADWDNDILASLLESVQSDGVDIEDVGFTDDELAALLGSEELPGTNEEIDENKIAETNTECPNCGFKWKI